MSLVFSLGDMMNIYLNYKIKWALTLIFLCVSAILSQPAQAGHKHYVKQTGNDAFDGHSLANAWQHYQRACTTLVAGDTVLIGAGTYSENSPYTEPLASFYPNAGMKFKRNGTADSGYIVAKGYQAIPIILGDTSDANPRNSASLGGKSYIKFDSLEFRKGWQGGIVGSGMNNIKVVNCIIDSTNSNHDSNHGGFYTAQGSTYNIEIRNCKIFDIGSTRAGFNPVNTNGIHIFEGDSILIVENEIYSGVGNGIFIKGTNKRNFNITIDSNTIYGFPNNCGVLLSTQVGRDSALVRWNTIYGCRIGVFVGHNGVGETDTYIYNNTIDCDVTGNGIQSRFGRIDNLQFFNNIVYRPGLSGWETAGFSFRNEEIWTPTNIYEDYNLFFGRTDSIYYRYPAATTYNPTTWRNANPTGVLSGHGLHTTVGDPLFADPTNPNRIYTLQAGSPAASGGRGGIYPSYRGAFSPTGVPADTTKPVIGAVQATSITASGATITWTTNEPATSQVNYGLTTSYGSSTTLDAAYLTSHSQSLIGLTAGTLYHYRVRSRDAAGNEAIGTDFTFTTAATPADTTKPVIGAVQATSITASGATITWTTNEPATSQVNYGLTTSYGSSTTLDAAYVTSHSQSLTGLTAGTLYHYRVRSRDAASNEAIGTDFTFTTTAAPTDTTMVNYALGRVASVSGTYPDPVYTVAAITNGTIAPRTPAATWASDQSALAHWVEVDFGAVRPVSRVRIWWAWNSARAAWMTSNQYTIQSWNGTSYSDVVTVTSPPVDSVRMTSFAPVSTSRIRIYQPANMGPLTYPTILWLTEFEVLGSQDIIPPEAIDDLQ
jgi:hypothetical protein